MFLLDACLTLINYDFKVVDEIKTFSESTILKKLAIVGIPLLFANILTFSQISVNN